MVRRPLPGPDPWYEPPVLLHVVRHIGGVKNDGRIEVTEEKDEECDEEAVDEGPGPEVVGDILHPRVLDELSDGGGEDNNRGGKNGRDDARGVDLQGQMGALTPVHPTSHNPLGILDRDPSLTGFHKDDPAHHRQHEGHQHEEQEDLQLPDPDLLQG